MWTIVALALVGSPAAGMAPVPKEAPAPTIDGKYSLISMSSPDDRGGPNNVGFGGVGGPGGVRRMTTASMYMVGPATITKSTITLEGRNVISTLAPNGPTVMEYALDTTKSPMNIDVNIVNLRGKKTKALGVAEMVGDRLVIAIAPTGEDRPKNTEEDGNVTVYYLQKAPPPPKTEFRIVAMTVGKEAEAEKELNKLAAEGFELTSTTAAAPDAKSSPTTVHFVLKRVTR